MVYLAVALVVGAAAIAEGAMTLDQIVAPGTRAEVLGTGYGFSEGPAADAEGNVYFSDGKNDSIYFYRVGQEVTLFVNDSTDANGMEFNTRGELVVCEGAAYRVVAFDVKTKKKRILADQFEGTHFNEPNDVAVDAQDGVYFSDPNYRHRGQETVMKEDTYYVDAQGKVTRVSSVCQKPNGVLLSADDKTFYLADNKGQVIYKYDVVGPGKLANETRFIEVGAGPDGMTLDEQGNLYIGCGKAGVRIFSPQGKLIGSLDDKYGIDYASNCSFGGKDFSTLYITSRDKFLGIKTNVTGVKPWPARKKG
jgi:gluconolactonase